MSIKYLNFYLRIGKQFDLIAKFKMITRASSHMMDLVKDSLIIVEILISQNGFASLMAQETPYIKGVRLSYLQSIPNFIIILF